MTFIQRKVGSKIVHFMMKENQNQNIRNTKKVLIHEIKLTLYFFNFNITLICFGMIFPQKVVFYSICIRYFVNLCQIAETNLDLCFQNYFMSSLHYRFFSVDLKMIDRIKVMLYKGVFRIQSNIQMKLLQKQITD